MSYNGLQTIRVDKKISGQTRKINIRAFVLKDGEAATIYIPVSKLGGIDYRRLKEIEEKGGEMLTTMRDTKLSNGKNALALYQNLIETQFKPEFEEKQNREATRQEEETNEEETNEETVSQKTETTKPTPKKRGRPPKKR